MIVLDLCRQLCPEKIPVKIAGPIGFGGADGEIFGIENIPNKVIKFSIIYNRFDNLMEAYKEPQDIYHQDLVPVLDYIMRTHPLACATIYQYGCLGEYSRPMPYWNNGIQTFIIHYYIMERLFPLSEDEKKVFHSIVSHEDRRLIKDFSSEKLNKILQGLAYGLDFNLEMINLFCENLRICKINHNDLHQRNILKSING